MNKTNRWWILVGITLVVIAVVFFWITRHNTYETEQPITADPSDCNGDLRFAVIGDFGDAGKPEADVAALIHGCEGELIVTTGHNNNTYGKASNIANNTGQVFCGNVYT